MSNPGWPDAPVGFDLETSLAAPGRTGEALAAAATVPHAGCRATITVHLPESQS